MKNTKIVFKLAFTGIMIALMFALSWTPLGMLPLGFASATTIFIPVAIGICVMDDFRFTLALGFGFGLSSLVRALAPAGPLDPFFVNPLVSILPRVIAAILTHLVFRGLQKVIKVKQVNASITGLLMAFFNTLFTIPLLILFIQVLGDGVNTIGMSYWAFIIVILPQMGAEIIVGGILTGLIFTGIYAVQSKTIARDQEESEEPDEKITINDSENETN